MSDLTSQGFPGWFQKNDDPRIIEANVAIITSRTGGLSPIVSEINYADGSIQYYEVRGGIGFNGPRIPLFIQSASGAKTIQNQGNLNDLKPEDIARIESSVKDVAFRANQKLATNEQQEALRNSPYYKSQGNVAGGSNGNGTGTGGTGTGTEATVTAPENTINDFLSEVKGGEIRSPSAYSNLTYPLNMSSSQDCITFTMIEYVPRAINTDVLGNIQNFLGNQIFGDRKKPDGTVGVSGGTVTLPIQPTITDSNAVSWQDSSMDAIKAATAAGAGEFGLIPSSSSPTPKPTTQQTEENKESVGKLAGYTLAEAAASGEGGGFFTRGTGAIVNPNLELLFNGPTVRSFNFTFSMSARNGPEAEQIRQIIRFFKQGMSVKKAQSSLFLKTPHVFDIKYLYRGGGTLKEHPWINKIKTSALTNCSVNYTPSGSYATFTDGAMTQYDLSLTFTELEPIYDDDYGQTEDGMIGY